MDQGRPLPAFPAVRSGWWGVCLPHLELSGIRADLTEPGEELGWYITFHHEQAHQLLGWYPSGYLLRYLMFLLWGETLHLCRGQATQSEGGQLVLLRALEKPVVAQPGLSGAGGWMQHLWQRALDLDALSDPVHEVFAVWWSLTDAHGVTDVERAAFSRLTEGQWQPGLTENERNAYARFAKLEYEAAPPGERIPEFASLYDAFAGVADRLGGLAGWDAADVAAAALATARPEHALRQTLARLERVLDAAHSLSDRERGTRLHEAMEPIRSMAQEQLPPPRRDPLAEQVAAIVEAADPWNFRELPGLIEKLAAALPGEPGRWLAGPLGEDIVSWLGGHGDLPSVSVEIDPHAVGDGGTGLFFDALLDQLGLLPPVPFDVDAVRVRAWTDEDRGSVIALEWVWLESLSQQLRRGRGLRCPFWRPGSCCGRQALLRGLLEKTVGRPESWRPQGCLTDG
jgi:hypothetical protein